MYHELTSAQKRRRRTNVVLAGVCVVLVIVLIALVFNIAQINGRTQGAHALRESILNSAMQCAAVEGAYPSTLAHLEENYGLRINHDDFIVQYEIFAENVVPSVVVTPR